jgi:polyisoprenoid-binding protein YceI
VNFDTSTGSAGGLIAVDARSGDSGNKARDRKMHKEILESDKFSDITFAPQHVRGQILPEGNSQVTMDGLMTLHGQSHPMSITVPVTVHSRSATADLAFVVPYVQWGLKNPSTFILKVSENVNIDVHAVGQLQLSSR